MGTISGLTGCAHLEPEPAYENLGNNRFINMNICYRKKAVPMQKFIDENQIRIRRAELPLKWVIYFSWLDFAENIRTPVLEQ